MLENYDLANLQFDYHSSKLQGIGKRVVLRLFDFMKPDSGSFVGDCQGFIMVILSAHRTKGLHVCRD